MGDNFNNVVKFVLWLVATLAIFGFAIRSYISGDMIRWFYYQAQVDGYAINDRTFAAATEENPIYLTVVTSGEIAGPVAVPVKAGDMLPQGADGIIAMKTVEEARRVALDGVVLKVMIPYQVKEDKGFKYRDGFKHKGVQTYPWSGVWNLAVILAIGFCLGMLAQSFTDLLGIRFGTFSYTVRQDDAFPSNVPSRVA